MYLMFCLSWACDLAECPLTSDRAPFSIHVYTLFLYICRGMEEEDLLAPTHLLGLVLIIFMHFTCLLALDAVVCIIIANHACFVQQ